MNLVIPTREVERVGALLKQEPSTLRRLTEELRQWKTFGSVDEFAGEVAKKVDATNKDLVLVIQTLMGWYVVRSNFQASAEETTDSFITAAARRTELRDGWEKIRDEIVAVLSQDATLGVVAKSMYLRSEVFRTFLDVHVLTDARPIFGANEVGAPSAFVITHTLRITAREDDAKRKVWHFSMDMEDIRTLKSTLERAIKKHEALTKFVASTSATIME